MVLFYHNNYYIGFSQQKAYLFLVSLFFIASFAIFLTQRFFIIPIFLRKQSWRNSFAMKLCGNCIFSTTKFSEMWWNDSAFEDSEEHWKLWRREVEIFCFLKRFFTMLRFVQNDTVCFLLTIRNLNYFWNAKIFYYSYVFKEAKWEFASELMKRVF